MVSGADPLNLAGILTPGARLPALAGNRLLFEDGVPAAMLSAGEVRLFGEVDPATEWLMRKALLGTAQREPIERQQPTNLRCKKRQARRNRPPYSGRLTSLRRTIIYAAARELAG